MILHSWYTAKSTSFAFCIKFERKPILFDYNQSIMKKIHLFFLLFSLSTSLCLGQKSPKGTADISLDYYLPTSFTYDEKVPTPKQALGFEVGEWTVDYDQLIRYFEKLAESSPRVKFEVFGHSYEKRPQVMLTITAPTNLENLEKIKENRQMLRDPKANLNPDEMPLVLAAGYSVHGNEAPSSSETKPVGATPSAWPSRGGRPRNFSSHP